MAPQLLGHRVVSTVDGHRTEGIIVETEAYIGPQDPASHAAERIGRTARNESMFGAAGLAYVYRIYGVHWCLNVVTGAEGFPAAVLIRALAPMGGQVVMGDRRGGRAPLASGPGRLCEALAITGALDGHDLTEEPLRLTPGTRPDQTIAISPRIGIRRAADWPLRFYIQDHPAVSGRRRTSSGHASP